jgi:hypothetical protein
VFGLGLPEWVIIFVILGVILVPLIFYVLALQKALSQCSPGCRTLSPERVWLLLIPLFGLIWHFIIVTNLAKSLHNEFAKRNITEAPLPGRGVGLAMCIFSVATVIPYAGFLPGIAALVCWVYYWDKITDYSAKLRDAVSPQVAQPVKDFFRQER